MATTEEKPGEAIEKIPEPGPLVLAVTGKGPVPQVDTQLIRERINLRLLGATKPEDLFAAGDALSFDELLGVPVEAHDLFLLKSSFEGEGPGVFMVIDAVRGDDGEQIVISTGAENVMTRLAIAKERGWLPFAFRVEKAANPTTAGFYPYLVKPA